MRSRDTGSAIKGIDLAYDSYSRQPEATKKVRVWIAGR